MCRLSFVMLSIFLAFSFALVALGGAAQEEGQSALNGVKIGYVDLVRAMAECEAGKKAQDQLKKEVENSEQRLLKQRERVEQIKEELEKKAMVLREEERDALGQDYRQSLRDFERRYKDAEEDLKIRDRQLTGRIMMQLQQIVAELGEQGAYTVILEGNNTVVLYGQQDIDLTDRVIQEHNKRFSQQS